MTKAMTEIDNQLVVVTIIASYDEHIRICMLQEQILLCRITHLIPCFQPDVRYRSTRVFGQKFPVAFECNP